MSDVLGLGAGELGQAYRRGTLSPVEVTRAYLDRIAASNDRLRAYVEVYAEPALAQARASEQRLASGLPTGLLEGVPLALKDLLHVEGRRTTAGSTVFADRAPSSVTSTVASRLMGAGAVVLGKANLVEFAYGGWGTNQGMGSPVNPWDPSVERCVGGSSSGSGVAVSAGLAVGAIGTDTGGSVRIPSAFCGLTGLKTTQGRVSNHGVDLVSHTLDTVGPMAWTAEDAALLLQAMHGPDPHDPATLQRAPEDFLSRLREPVAGLRISVAPVNILGHVEPAIQRAVDDAVGVLMSLGCLRRDEAFSHIDFVADQVESGVIISSEAYAEHGHLLQGSPPPGDAAARARLLSGAAIAAPRYAAALRERQRRIRDFARVFEHTDLLVLPTLPVTARPLATIDEADLAPSRLTRFVGYYGLSALALPCGLSPEGLPMSLQLVAPAFHEARLLRAGVAFQSATAFHRARPSSF
ncbi:amidase [Hydrogenophaga sp.]|uniref:amidase n=1 Tax=Hydrogenophaga sp. TaxID=1904254 RepID=UPI00260198FD|nr:amidase [Hydrogenophaga sp.]MCW5654550.1 amidase [Hydrogenophaga sp.]